MKIKKKEDNKIEEESNSKKTISKNSELKTETLQPINIDKNNQGNVLENLRSKVLNTAIISNDDFVNKDLDNLENHTGKNEESELNENENIFNNISQKIDFEKIKNNDEEQINNEDDQKDNNTNNSNNDDNNQNGDNDLVYMDNEEKSVKKIGDNDNDDSDDVEEIY